MLTRHDPRSELAPGDHACMLEGGSLADFVTDGLLFGDRIAYVAAESARHRLCDDLHRQGHDVAVLARSGRLVLLDSDAVYGMPGSFDASAVVAGFEGQVTAARDEGFRTLRSAGGLSPEMLAAVQVPEIVAYELDCDRMAARSGVIALCEYPADEEDLVRHVAIAHNRRILPGPLDPGFGIDVRSERLVRIVGEVDAFAAGELGVGLAGVGPLDDGVHDLDVSDLRFIDSAGMRALGHWATSLSAPQPPRVVGASSLFRRVWDVLELGPVTWVGLAA